MWRPIALAASLLLPLAAQAAPLVVFSSRQAPQDQVLLEAFARESGIQIEYLETEIVGLAARLQRPDAPGDLVLVPRAADLHALKQAGLLQPVRSSKLGELVPPLLRDPDANWYAISQCAAVIAYRSDRLKSDAFSTYEALADPRWNGRLLVASSAARSQLSLLASLIPALGPEKAEAWARDYAANAARHPWGNEADQVASLIAGEGDATIGDSCQLARRWEANIGVYFPNQADRGTHMDLSGMAVPKQSRRVEDATRLMEFLLSQPAQQMLAAAGREYPVRTDVNLPPPLDQWGRFKADPLDKAVLGDNQAKAAEIAQRAGWQ